MSASRRTSASRSSAVTGQDLARIAVFAALTAALGLMAPIPVPGLPVPITAQTLGVMLAGAVLGPWKGAASMVLLELLVALGLPLLTGGLGVFFGPTAGYLIGWIIGAFVVGLIVHARGSRPTWPRVILGCLVGGMLVIYAVGIPVQSWITGLPLGDSIVASLVFLPGDLVKAVVATVVVMTLYKAYPRAFHG